MPDLNGIHDFDPVAWRCRRCGATGEEIEDNVAVLCRPKKSTSKPMLDIEVILPESDRDMLARAKRLVGNTGRLAAEAGMRDSSVRFPTATAEKLIALAERGLGARA